MSNNTQSPVDPFAAQQELLRERLHHLLVVLHPMLYADVVLTLEAEGKLLSQPSTEGNPSVPPQGAGKLTPLLTPQPHTEVNPSSPHSPALPAGAWPLMTLLVAQYVSPDIDPLCASSVAVAIECFVCAIDLLDDVIDEDQTATLQALGIARTLNVSTALLVLAQQAILSLSEQGVASALILRLLRTLQEAALVVTAGQHWDVLAEQRSAQDFTREECIEIAAAKAGSVMRLACQLGALCAGADDVLCGQFSELGTLLGIAAQLDNDSHDLYSILEGGTSTVMSTEGGTATRSVNTDLVRGKKTLPVVLAASMEGTLQSTEPQAGKEQKEYVRALHEGIVTTWGICLLYRERARDRLQEIDAQKPVAPILRRLLGL